MDMWVRWAISADLRCWRYCNEDGNISYLLECPYKKSTVASLGPWHNTAKLADMMCFIDCGSRLKQAAGRIPGIYSPCHYGSANGQYEALHSQMTAVTLS